MPLSTGSYHHQTGPGSELTSRAGQPGQSCSPRWPALGGGISVTCPHKWARWDALLFVMKTLHLDVSFFFVSERQPTTSENLTNTHDLRSHLNPSRTQSCMDGRSADQALVSCSHVPSGCHIRLVRPTTLAATWHPGPIWMSRCAACSRSMLVDQTCSTKCMRGRGL